MSTSPGMDFSILPTVTAAHVSDFTGLWDASTGTTVCPGEEEAWNMSTTQDPWCGSNVTMVIHPHRKGPLEFGFVFDTLLPVLFMLESLAIVLANMATIGAVLKTATLRSITTNILIVYLSLADFLIGPVLFYLASFVLFRLKVNPHLHAFFGMGTFSMSLRVSVLMLTLIGMDRLVAVWKPLSYSKIVTRRRVHAVALVTWLYVAVIVGTTFAYGVSQSDVPTLLGGHPGDIVPTHLYRGVLVPHFYVPVVINCFLYGAIFVLLRRQARRVQAMSGTEPSAREERRRRQTRRISKMMTQVLGGMIITLAPFAILVQIHRPNDPGAPMWWRVSYICSMLLQYVNSFINPVIYSWQSPEWSRGYRALLGCRRVGPSGGNSNSAASIPTQPLQATVHLA